MNKLVLIGNGFDLAHGLKTSYSDFIVWYLNKVTREIYYNAKYEDEIFAMRRGAVRFDKYIKSLKDFHDFTKFASEVGIGIKVKSDFFEKLLECCNEFQWVNIESMYYQEVVRLYKNYDSGNKSKVLEELRGLNLCLDTLREELILYLTDINTKDSYNPEIEKHFTRHIRVQSRFKSNTYVRFVNFNYTSTIENYLHIFEESKIGIYPSLTYIHGKLGDERNPVIFGYGDEMDPYYQAIENLNENDFLKNIKSFWYFKAGNYRDLSSFLESEKYEVFIFGHSCGISDRILLNSIFEHKNCESIQLFYHNREDGTNDYFEKTQEISRHFSAENKGKMRNLIVPLDPSCAIC